MKTILIALGLLPLISFGGIKYTNINDGYHQVIQGQTFEAIADESISANNIPDAPNIECNTVDSSKIDQVKVKWIMTVNNYDWSYTQTTSNFMTWKILPPSSGVYKIDIKGVIDNSSYQGPYAYIICRTMP